MSLIRLHPAFATATRLIKISGEFHHMSRQNRHYSSFEPKSMDSTTNKLQQYVAEIEWFGCLTFLDV
jgi:hypothetical protein